MYLVTLVQLHIINGNKSPSRAQVSSVCKLGTIDWVSLWQTAQSSQPSCRPKLPSMNKLSKGKGQAELEYLVELDNIFQLNKNMKKNHVILVHLLKTYHLWSTRFHLGSIQLDIADSICASVLSNRLNRTMHTDGHGY